MESRLRCCKAMLKAQLCQSEFKTAKPVSQDHTVFLGAVCEQGTKYALNLLIVGAKHDRRLTADVEIWPGSSDCKGVK